MINGLIGYVFFIFVVGLGVYFVVDVVQNNNKCAQTLLERSGNISSLDDIYECRKANIQNEVIKKLVE